MKTVLTAVFAAVIALGLSLPCPALAQQAKPLVKLTTTKGDIVIELDTDKAPITAKNFLKNVQDGFYNGLIFHRVIGGFMIQGGGMDKDMREKSGRPTIQNEADNGLKNAAYTVAMARTNDPHSASTQFFINTVDNPALNHTAKNATGWGYAVFGKVVEGKQTVDAIKAVATTTRGMHQNVPVEPVVITKAEVVRR